MPGELLNKAQREADKDKARKHPGLALASARLAVAEALFEPDGWGGPDEERGFAGIQQIPITLQNEHRVQRQVWYVTARGRTRYLFTP